MERLLTVDEVAEILQINPMTVRNKALSGEIPSYKVGRCRRFRRSELERYLDGCSETQPRRY